MLGCPSSAHAESAHWFGYQLGGGIPAGVGYYNPKAWLAVDTVEKRMGDHYLGHVVGAFHQYGDGERRLKVRYWSVAGQVLWRMSWGAKPARCRD